MTKFAVYGGGPVAMLLALTLTQQGKTTELWRPSLPFEALKGRRVFAINRQVVDFLKSLDLNLSSALHPIRQMQIWDAKTYAQIQFAAADIGLAALAYTIDEVDLWQLIYQRVQQSGIKVFDLAQDEVCQQSKGAWFISGSRADFLGIADGAQSKMRQQLKIPCDTGAYHQQAIVASVKVSRPQENIAFQAFGPHGPLAFLPLGGENYSIVWSQDLKPAQHLMALESYQLLEQLNLAMDYHLGEVMAIEGLRSYPLHWLHAKAYYGQNWLLAGDAAHHFHPLAGLGLNTGIGDIIALSKLDFSPRGLGQYQRARKAEIAPIMLGMQLLKNCFAIQDNIWVKLRSFGMDALDHQLFIKKMMMKLVQTL